jgi:large subunit ribosomal protein L32
MAVPKKRTGHSAQGKRRSNWKATKPTLTKCPNCGQAVLAHTVCTACGTYKGKTVSKKGQPEVVETPVEEVKETKKAKKSTKKAKVEALEEAPKAEVVEEKTEEAKETSEEKTE